MLQSFNKWTVDNSDLDLPPLATVRDDQQELESYFFYINLKNIGFDKTMTLKCQSDWTLQEIKYQIMWTYKIFKFPNQWSQVYNNYQYNDDLTIKYCFIPKIANLQVSQENINYELKQSYGQILNFFHEAQMQKNERGRHQADNLLFQYLKFSILLIQL